MSMDVSLGHRNCQSGGSSKPNPSMVVDNLGPTYSAEIRSNDSDLDGAKILSIQENPMKDLSCETHGLDFGSEGLNIEAQEQEKIIEDHSDDNKLVEKGFGESNTREVTQLGSLTDVATLTSHNYQRGPLSEDPTVKSTSDNLVSASENFTTDSSLGLMAPTLGDVSTDPGLPQKPNTKEESTENSSQETHRLRHLESLSNEPSEQKMAVRDNEDNKSAETELGGFKEVEKVEMLSGEVTKISFMDHSGPASDDLTTQFTSDDLVSASGNARVDSSLEHAGPPPGDASENPGSLNLQHQREDPIENSYYEMHSNEFVESVIVDPSEKEQVIGADSRSQIAAETEIGGFKDIEQLESFDGDATKNSDINQNGPASEDLAINSIPVDLVPASGDAAVNLTVDSMGIALGGASMLPGLPEIQQVKEDSIEQHGPTKPLGRARDKKSKIGTPSPVINTRVLRSRSHEKPKAPEPNPIVVEDTSNGEKRGRKKKNKRMKNTSASEFSRMRTHLRYLLHRIKYEQNLIDAYSGEGWKGQSLEKIKPEKELQRAKSQILHYKLKIRNLFQRLDESLSEGQLPETLFDSEGQIDSEDIFCAKCGSKDLAADNDIILCDGACERGYHQFCLEPPLLNSEIPPDDEGWLCPGCDCKVDCIDLLNDFQGSSLSVTDCWEKVYPEAAVSAEVADNGCGLPSDDSEDDDYNPENPEVDEQSQEDESSSDESTYFSVSDGSAAHNEQVPGFPSDDSEDESYDPSGPDRDVEIKQESSSSDFTSDSEDLEGLCAELDGGTSPNGDQGRESDQKSCRGSEGERPKVGRMKGQSLRDELSYLLDSDAATVSGKRHMERLDYKMLHDETYGNVSSDSSDEDFEDDAPGRRSSTKRAPSTSDNKALPMNSGPGPKDENKQQKESEYTPRRSTRKKVDPECGSSVPAASSKRSSKGGSGSRSATKSYKRLGEDVTQRLYQSFKENQYPDRAMKENLAEELGISIQQVSKWFENARWSARHSSRVEFDMIEPLPKKDTGTKQSNEPAEADPVMASKDASGDGDERTEATKLSPGAKGSLNADMDMVGEKASTQKSLTLRSRKRKGETIDKAVDRDSNVEKKPRRNMQADSPKSQVVRRSSRLQGKDGESKS